MTSSIYDANTAYGTGHPRETTKPESYLVRSELVALGDQLHLFSHTLGLILASDHASSFVTPEIAELPRQSKNTLIGIRFVALHKGTSRTSRVSDLGPHDSALMTAFLRMLRERLIELHARVIDAGKPPAEVMYDEACVVQRQAHELTHRTSSVQYLTSLLKILDKSLALTEYIP